ncbi:hypothetical protein [Roseiconus lacunae]|uniref:hypothetical protein n=1 Tax=Roseiconus lacunae TaxID=2605694 RepID=UPI0011F21C1C|nr:hypothetical protein [Roseiconus lacunae]
MSFADVFGQGTSGSDPAEIAAAIIAELGDRPIVVTRKSPQFDPKQAKFRLVVGDDYLVANHRQTSFAVDFDRTPTPAWTVEVAAKDKYGNQFAGVGSIDANPDPESDYMITIQWPRADLIPMDATANGVWMARVKDAEGNQQTEVSGPITVANSSID